MEQESPPCYVMLLSSPNMMDEAELLAEDVERLRAMPPKPLAELQEHLRRLQAGETRDSLACIWLDQVTMRCRYHDYRPSICRDFEVGSEECLEWRQAYDID